MQVECEQRVRALNLNQGWLLSHWKYFSLPYLTWGHVNPILAIGEELVLRGHEVTLCIGVDEENNAKFEEKAMEYGVLHSHFESNLLLLIKKQTKKPDTLKLFYIGGELSGYLDGMMQHLNQSLSAKSVDIVLGNNF